MCRDSQLEPLDCAWFDARIGVQEEKDIPFCKPCGLITPCGVADIGGVLDEGDGWKVTHDAIEGTFVTGIVDDNNLKVCRSRAGQQGI
jgi:hypothetical protein